MPIIPAGYAQLNIVFGGTQNPNGAQITLGLNVGTYSNPPSIAAEDATDAFLQVLVNLNASTSVIEGRVKFGPTETGPSGLQGYSSNGGDGGAAAAPNGAYLVHKVTALGGRAGRGRMYLPGPSEADVGGDGSIDATFLSALQTDLDAWHTDLVALDLEPVLLHDAGSPITLPTAITSFQADSTLATQRRRLRR